MKKRIISFLAAVLTSAFIMAQVPNSFSYQAVVRDAAGALQTKKSVAFRISILSGTTAGAATSVYTETQTATTDDYGTVSLSIGAGTKVSGDFTTINWSTVKKFIKIEMDITGGTTYVDMGTSQLLSVPFALNSHTVDIEKDADTTNELQTLSLKGDTLRISKGNNVVLNNSTISSNLIHFEADSGSIIINSATYTVPSNMNLLISDIDLPTSCTCNGKDAIINGIDSLSFTMQKHFPLVLSPGNTINLNYGAVVIGQLIPLKYNSIYLSITKNPYTVPVGKKLVLLGVYKNGYDYVVGDNGITKIGGVEVGLSSSAAGFHAPIILKSGSIISTTNAIQDIVINGYLINN